MSALPALLVLVIGGGVAHAQPQQQTDALEAQIEKWVARARELTDGRVGELGIGAGAGIMCGFVGKKVQGVVVNMAILGAVAGAGACYFGWTTPEQLKEKAIQVETWAEEQVRKRTSSWVKRFDQDLDGDVDWEDSKIHMSSVVKRHGALAASFAGGALVGYRIG
eukprot:CAMPEP_0183348880 /NCGR_PEP_ID=MMETSP0164_2-20130417/13246_1 /TAXON_ID=221442 /ORGANISM="Coccolithus pelagicus ssp braarudi, Strain PLY182g" /LENGTH=164 /DNA_ID=CAMNT_0025520533 /DNA_START=21 /DNA_END=515 /DNA_ORIENTATION=-